MSTVMTVLELLIDPLQAVSLDDGVDTALNLSLEQGHRAVPVVDEDGVLVASLRLVDLLACEESSATVRDCRLNSPHWIRADAQVLEAVGLVVDNEIDLLPVVDGAGRYVGAVDLTGLLRSVSRLLRVGEPGSLIEVDVSPRDYTLARLIHTVEENGAKVLAVNSESARNPESDVRVMLRVNTGDTVRIKAVLEHYGYNVVAVDREQSSAEDIQQRVREFMHYLDV